MALLTAALLAGGFYAWQPYRFDLFQKDVPSRNPWIDPDSAGLFSPRTRVVIVTAHPDDSEFYVGGTLTKLQESGARVSLIVATDGDKAYNPFVDHQRERMVRLREQREAAAMWGASEVVFLGYSDSLLPNNYDLRSRLVRELERIRPTYILSFDSEYPPRLSHRDHRTIGEAVEMAINQSHIGVWLLRFSSKAPNFAVDVTPEWERKTALLHVHKSEFSGAKRRRVDAMIARSARLEGRRIRASYAEAFRCSRIL